VHESVDALFAALGSFAALASFSLSLAIWLWRLRRNEIAHLYKRVEQIEHRLESFEETLAEVRERVARLEEKVRS